MCLSAANQLHPHNLGLLCCGQRQDPKGAIQGTHFLDRKVPAKPQFSVQGVLVFHVHLCNGNGWRGVLETESGYLEQKEEAKLWWQRLENQHWTVVCQLADKHKKELRKWIVAVQCSSVKQAALSQAHSSEICVSLTSVAECSLLNFTCGFYSALLPRCFHFSS